MSYTKVILAVFSVVLGAASAGTAQLNEVRTTAQISGNPVVLRGGSDSVVNGGFEGGLSNWNPNGAASLSSTSVRSGGFSLHLGTSGGLAGSAYQAVWLPDTKPIVLEYWVGNVTQAEPWYLPSHFARIIDLSALAITPTQTFFSFPEFRRQTADISHFAGQPVYIQFTTARDPLLNSQGAGTHSEAYIDDVRILAGATIYASHGDMGVGLFLVGRAGGPNPTWLPDDIAWRVNPAPWSHAGVTQGVAFGLPFTEGPHTAEYYSSFQGNVEAVNSLTVNIDDTPPTTALRFLTPVVASGGQETIENGGFEAASGWTFTGAASVTTDSAYDGLQSARLGNEGAPGAASQTVTLTAGTQPWLLFRQADSTVDAPVVTIKDVSDKVLWSGVVSSGANWERQVLNLSGLTAQTVQLVFSDPAGAGVLIDEVSLLQDPNVLAGTGNTSLAMGYNNIDVTNYQVDGGATGVSGLIKAPGAGSHTISYWSIDYLGRSHPPAEATFTVDATPPTGSVLINGGDAVTNSTEVTLTVAASDASGVARMRTKLSPGNWGPWGPLASSVSVDFGDATPGIRTACVQFEDLVGNISGEYCDDIEYRLPGQVSIGEAKQLPLGRSVVLYQKKMTAFWQTDAANGIYYIEEPDRSAGIMVKTSTGFPSAVGALVTVYGTTGIGGDPELFVAATDWTQYGLVTALKGYGTGQNSLGGGPSGQQPGVGLMNCLNTIGKIVRVWGKVNASTPSYFVIDDGSGISLGGIGPGVTVELPAFASQPLVGKIYEVTGISTAVNRNGSVVNHVRPRSQSDIKPLE